MSDKTLSEQEAENAKLHAEAQKFLAEAEKAQLESENIRLMMEMTKLHVAQTQDQDAFNRASDIEHQIYRFRGLVDGDTVGSCIAYLTRWSRINPGSEMTVIINSPGGLVYEGMELFDTILELRRAGHYLTGVGRGHVASMGSILLQAFDWRVMGPGCGMLVHQPSAGVYGSAGAIEDVKEHMDMLQTRVLDIYADRCARSDADKPLTRRQIQLGWNRKDWWLSSDDCLKGGLVDEIR